MNSMTGFGRAATQIDSFSARVEISGVNRKQVEIAFGIPRSCTDWEQHMRPAILESVSRGRIFVSIAIEPIGGSSEGQINVDEAKLKAFMSALRLAEESALTPFPATAADLIRLDIIHSASSVDLENAETWTLIEPTFKEALSNFIAMRATEGHHLKQDLLARLDTLRSIKQNIAKYAPEVPLKLRENMLQRLNESGLPVDMNDDRIIRELALFADKCDISEETSRLDSHFSQFLAICDAKAPAGRPLDFLCQEIFREFNTIGSKANDSTLAHLVVSAKTELEKIREQVQNIE